jgi:hypothetical protein
MKWIRERVKTSWDWNSTLLKDLLDFQNHLRIYMNKRKQCRGAQCLLELFEGSVLLKDLPNPSRPNRTYMNNEREIRQNNVMNLEGPIPYVIIWLLMPLKVLHNPPIPIRIFTPKSKGKMDNIHNVVNNVNNGI